MTSTGQPLISVHPEELKFIIELEKPSYCDLKVVNNTEHHVAFKVKTTSPKKYFVRPNTNVIQPWDACFIKVTLQAQQEYPPDMLCKDKFLLQSTVVPPNSDVYDLSPETFNKGEGKIVEECKLRVVYVSPNSGHEADASGDSSGNPDNAAVQRAKDERDAVVRQTQQLQRELDMLKKKKNKGGGASFKFAMIVALVGIMLGFFLNIYFSSPSPSTSSPSAPSPSVSTSSATSPSVSTKME